MRRLPRTLLFTLSLMLVSALPAAPSGLVTVEICEKGVSSELPKSEQPPAAENGVITKEATKDTPWPEKPVVTEQFTEDVFGLFDLPQKYISTGVRANRAFPTL